MNEAWATLELEPTDDLTAIKQAYARLIKQFRPDTFPEQFKKIRAAYEAILNHLQNPNTEVGEPEATAPSVETATAEEEKTKASDDGDFKQMLLDKFMDIYQDENRRNDASAWKAILDDNYIELSPDQYFGAIVLRNIIKWQLLYKPEFELKPDVYITLFDFFQIPEREFMDDYNPQISQGLLSQIQQRREQIYLESIEPSLFNYHKPELQVKAEKYVAELLLLEINTLHELSFAYRCSIAKEPKKERRTLQRVAFKYLLDVYLDSTKELNEQIAGNFYYIFAHDTVKRDLKQTLISMGYSSLDIDNAYQFCKQAFNKHCRTPFMIIWRWFKNTIYVAGCMLGLGFIGYQLITFISDIKIILLNAMTS